MIRPLFMTSVDWATWNECRKAASKTLPTRDLDTRGIKLDVPSALVMALDPNSFRQSLDHILRLVSLGFLVSEIDDATAARASVLHQGPTVYGDELILGGNLVDWRLSVVLGSQDDDPKIRAIFNAIYSYCRQAGIQELWSEYTRITHEDRTFSLRRK